MSKQPKRFDQMCEIDGDHIWPIDETGPQVALARGARKARLVELRKGESISGLEEQAVIEAAKATKCRCFRTGKYEGDCRHCGDSTFDHECVYPVYDCTDPLCSAVRALREAKDDAPTEARKESKG